MNPSVLKLSAASRQIQSSGWLSASLLVELLLNDFLFNNFYV